MMAGLAALTMYPIRIFLVDDHPKVLAQIESRLAAEDDLAVVGRAVDCEQAADTSFSEQPNILLIDPVTRDGLNLGLIEKLKAQFPATAIVVLTAFADTALQIDLKKIGVKHILEKGVDSQRLISTLREVVNSDHDD